MAVAGVPVTAEDRLRLPRPPGVLRRLLAAHPLAVDVGVVVTALLGGWVQTDDVGLQGPLWGVLGEWWFVVNVVTAGALMLRRRHPVWTLAVVALGAVRPQPIQRQAAT